MARYVLPVPAGPMQMVTVLSRMAWIYCFCPSVLHFTRLALVGYGHGIARGGHDLFCLAAGRHLYGLADSPIVDGFPFRHHPLQGFQRLSRSPARLRFAAHLYLLIAGVDGYIQRCARSN